MAPMELLYIDQLADTRPMATLNGQAKEHAGLMPITGLCLVGVVYLAASLVFLGIGWPIVASRKLMRNFRSLITLQSAGRRPANP